MIVIYVQFIQPHSKVITHSIATTNVTVFILTKMYLTINANNITVIILHISVHNTFTQLRQNPHTVAYCKNGPLLLGECTCFCFAYLLVLVGEGARDLRLDFLVDIGVIIVLYGRSSRPAFCFATDCGV